MQQAPKNIGIGDMAKVRWEDALSCTHMVQEGMCWVHYEPNEEWELVVNMTVGIILHIDNTKVVVTMTKNQKEEGYCDTPVIIPLGCVTHIWRLEEVS